jgi:membrane-bound lytic murein transglycosylase B
MLLSIVMIFGVFSFRAPVFSDDSSTDLTPAQRAALQAQLDELNQEIAQQQTILDQKKTEGQSITRDIAILDAQIKQAQLKIQAHNIAIQNLGKDITVKTGTITTLSTSIDQGHASLAAILDETNQLDSFSVAEAFLAKRNFADFFQDFDNLASLQDSLKTILDNIKDARTQTEAEKATLDSQRNQEIDMKVDVETEQKNIQTNEATKKKLLSLNQQDQKGYQSLIAQNQAKAAAINNKLFPLRDAGSIKFGDALTYAKAASVSTGVRPAFILAILQQESNLGANVGSCYMTNDDTGAGVKITSGAAVSNVMKPSRDVIPFLQITQSLGRDPHQTRVSCPFSVGYGGAMGPSQFIASTWMLYKDRLASILNKTNPDPWSANDAITATALYLSDIGASAQTYTAERNAACRYYSGQSCAGSNAFYGDQVMSHASSIQDDINVLQQ